MMAGPLQDMEDGFRLDYFLKSRNVTGGDLAAECRMDIGRMSRLRNKGARPRVYDVYLLVQGARALLKDPTITANDFIYVPGGVSEAEDGSHKPRRTTYGPHGPIKGTTLSEIIQEFTGQNGEKIVPMIHAIATDTVHEDFFDEKTKKRVKRQVPQKAQDKLNALKWLVDHGGFEGDLSQDIKVAIQIFDCEGNLKEEHPLVWNPRSKSPPPVSPTGVSEPVLESGVRAGENPDS